MADTLTEWLAGNPSPGERLRVVETLADALNRTHERGVVHGGLEPSVVRIADGVAELAESGFASAAERSSAGAAAYTPPEVVQGGSYSQKSEIHAAGLLFYEILSGRNPFLRGTAAASREAVLTVQAQPLFEARREIPRDLSDAIMACLEKDPDWRPKDLTYILELSGQAGAKTKGASKATRQSTGRISTVPKTPSFGSSPHRASSSSSSRLPLFALLIVALVAAGAGGWYWMQPGSSAPPKPKVAAITPTLATQPAEAPATVAPGPTASAPAADPRTPATTLPAKAKERQSEPEPTPEPALPPPTAAPATQPVATLRPVPVATPTPEPEPVPAVPVTEAARTPPITQAAAAAGSSNEPALLKNLTPPVVKRGGTSILDVHGSGLRPDHQPLILKGKDVARGIQLVRQRLVNAGLIQVVILVDAGTAPGSYSVILTDSQGNATNALRFEVGH